MNFLLERFSTERAAQELILNFLQRKTFHRVRPTVVDNVMVKYCARTTLTEAMLNSASMAQGAAIMVDGNDTLARLSHYTLQNIHMARLQTIMYFEKYL